MATLLACCSPLLSTNSRRRRLNAAWPERKSTSWFCAPQSNMRIVAASASQSFPPEELLNDSKFARVNEDDPCFGPAAILLMGFGQDEVSKVRQFLRDIGGDFLKVLVCTSDMLELTLWYSFNMDQPDISKVKVPQGLPRICFVSGMTGEEIMSFVESFPKIGLADNAFAALVPKSAHKKLQEVAEEVMGDHESLTKK